MSVPTNGFPFPMRTVSGLLVLGLVALVLLTSAPPPASQPFAVAAITPSAAIAIVSDRSLAGRGDQLNLTMWLNVTGNGQIQQTWVNVTFATEPNPSDNALTQGPLPPSQPSACTFKVPSGWNLAWLCVGLRAGSYPWYIPAEVLANATVGHYQQVEASAVSTTGTGTASTFANVSVWIAGAVLRILDVDSDPAGSVRAGGIIQYWINVSNDARANSTEEVRIGTANDVTLTIRLDPGLHPGGGLENLTTEYGSLPPSSLLGVSFEAIVAGNLTPGTSIGIRVLLTYRDSSNHSIGPIEGQSPPLYVSQVNPFSTASLVAAAAIGLAAILTTLMVLLYAGQRKIVIDEVFLMTKGGLLIRHMSHEPELKKDDDIVASMFVAIQEFVRDSFRREASLDSVAFGQLHAAVVRGELTILAGVISQGDAESVTPELVAAVRLIESRYWDVLRNWDGSYAGLAGIDGILADLMKGAFRSPWRVQIA